MSKCVDCGIELGKIEGVMNDRCSDCYKKNLAKVGEQIRDNKDEKHRSDIKVKTIASDVAALVGVSLILFGVLVAALNQYATGNALSSIGIFAGLALSGLVLLVLSEIGTNIAKIAENQLRDRE